MIIVLDRELMSFTSLRKVSVFLLCFVFDFILLHSVLYETSEALFSTCRLERKKIARTPDYHSLDIFQYIRPNTKAQSGQTTTSVGQTKIVRIFWCPFKVKIIIKLVDGTIFTISSNSLQLVREF